MVRIYGDWTRRTRLYLGIEHFFQSIRRQPLNEEEQAELASCLQSCSPFYPRTTGDYTQHKRRRQKTDAQKALEQSGNRANSNPVRTCYIALYVSYAVLPRFLSLNRASDTHVCEKGVIDCPSTTPVLEQMVIFL